VGFGSGLTWEVSYGCATVVDWVRMCRAESGGMVEGARCEVTVPGQMKRRGTIRFSGTVHFQPGWSVSYHSTIPCDLEMQVFWSSVIILSSTSNNHEMNYFKFYK
jgi:hypothetical protein